MDKVIMSFPGLGIGEFMVNKIAFTIPIFGGLEIRWYGLIITVGMILAVLYAWLRTKEIGVSLDDLLDYAIFAILFGVLGARLYYVIMKGGYTSFMEIIAVWNGGLAIYGGVIGGALAVFGVSRYKKMSFGKMADCIIPGVMIAQALGVISSTARHMAVSLPREALCISFVWVCIPTRFPVSAVWPMCILPFFTNLCGTFSVLY